MERGGSMSEGESSNRRSAVRHNCNLTGHCHWDDAGAPRSCLVRIRNLSAGGISLVFDQAPNVIQFCVLELSNPSRTFSCSVRARLLYQVEQSGAYLVGASFPDKLDPMMLNSLLS
jgi:hypothetical protein